MSHRYSTSRRVQTAAVSQPKPGNQPAASQPDTGSQPATTQPGNQRKRQRYGRRPMPPRYIPDPMDYFFPPLVKEEPLESEDTIRYCGIHGEVRTPKGKPKGACWLCLIGWANGIDHGLRGAEEVIAGALPEHQQQCAPVPSSVTSRPRSHAIPIVNPETGENVLERLRSISCK